MNTRSLLKHEDEIFITLGAKEFICLLETWLSPRQYVDCELLYIILGRIEMTQYISLMLKVVGGGGLWYCDKSKVISGTRSEDPERGTGIRNKERNTL